MLVSPHADYEASSPELLETNSALACVMCALGVPLSYIVSTSDFLSTRLAVNLRTWEDEGWLNVRGLDEQR